MATGLEGPALKVVIDALVGLFNSAKKHRMTAEAKKKLSEAMRELLLIDGNIRSAEAKIRIAKAAGIIEGIELAEEMVKKRKTTKKKTPGTSRRRVTRKKISKKSVSKKGAGKKSSSKKPATKKRPTKKAATKKRKTKKAVAKKRSTKKAASKKH